MTGGSRRLMVPTVAIDVKRHQSPIHIGRTARTAKQTVKARKMPLPDYLDTVDHALKASELASLLGISRRAVSDKAARGILPSFRVGNSVRFDPHVVAKWLRQR